MHFGPHGAPLGDSEPPPSALPEDKAQADLLGSSLVAVWLGVQMQRPDVPGVLHGAARGRAAGAAGTCVRLGKGPSWSLPEPRQVRPVLPSHRGRRTQSSPPPSQDRPLQEPRRTSRRISGEQGEWETRVHVRVTEGTVWQPRGRGGRRELGGSLPAAPQVQTCLVPRGPPHRVAWFAPRPRARPGLPLHSLEGPRSRLGSSYHRW